MLLILIVIQLQCILILVIILEIHVVVIKLIWTKSLHISFSIHSRKSQMEIFNIENTHKIIDLSVKKDVTKILLYLITKYIFCHESVLL